MSDTGTAARVEELEIRYAHVEKALEVLTQTVLILEQTIKHQADKIELLEQQLRALQHSESASIGDEKPPHY